MNPYDHEDAFKAANLHAGSVINLPDALRSVEDRHQAKIMIEDLQKQYQRLFDAFINGVHWAREQAQLDKKDGDV